MSWWCLFGLHDTKETSFHGSICGVMLAKYPYEENGTFVLKTCKECGTEWAYFEKLNGDRQTFSVYEVKRLLRESKLE